jgi:ABC-2 type transport system ATP-binding protein
MTDAPTEKTDAPAPEGDGHSASGRAAPRPRLSSAGPAAISVEHVTHVYPVPLVRLKQLFRRAVNSTQALTDVTLRVREGEIFGLIGRNGAGKTTLTKIIATLIRPTEGTVSVRGFDGLREEERVRAQTGLAGAEERSFYWRLTAEQNLLFFARLYGMGTRDARRRISELLALFELEPAARKRFGELSTGNKQRMAIARAMLSRPPVLLLDEPTRSLDPVAAARMRAVIGDLARSAPPVSVLLTSHNLAEVEELCDRVAVISRGRIRATDTPAALRSLNRQRESVGLRLTATTVERAEDLLAGVLDNFAVSDEGGEVVVNFMRETSDDSLDRALRRLLADGARVVACESERATLLDVIELYEKEDARPEAAGASEVRG